MTIQIGFRDVEDAGFEVGWDLLSKGTIVVGKYDEPSIIDIIELATSNSIHPVLFDFRGSWFDVDIGVPDVARYVIGIDIPFNILIPPKGIRVDLYFDLVVDSLIIVYKILGQSRLEWRQGFVDIMRRLYDREGYVNNELVISELEILRNEASGFDKHMYSILYSFLRYLIYSGASKKIFGSDEPFDYEALIKYPSIINYSFTGNFYSSLFLYVVSIFASLLYSISRLNIFFCGDFYMPHLSALHMDILMSSLETMYNVIHFYSLPSRDVVVPYYNVVIDNRLLSKLWRRVRLNPLLFDDYSTHHLVSVGRLIPIRIERIVRRYLTHIPSPPKDIDDYKPPSSLIQNILSKVRDLGGVGLEGLYMYFREWDRGDVYMAVEWLWRNGFLRKEYMGNRPVYKVTIKGLMKLREGGGNG